MPPSPFIPAPSEDLERVYKCPLSWTVYVSSNNLTHLYQGMATIFLFIQTIPLWQICSVVFPFLMDSYESSFTSPAALRIA